MRRLMLVALAALAFPAVASAHATLRSTTPLFGHELRSAPRTITLHFDQRVTILAGAIKVLTSDGKNLAGPAHLDGTKVVAPVAPLAGPGHR